MTAPRPFRDMPGLPHRSFAGALHRNIQFFRDTIGAMRSLRQQFGDLCRIDLRKDSKVFAFGPENNRLIYGQPEVFRSVALTLGDKRYPSQHNLRTSIFKLNDRDHARMKRQLLPPFQRSGLAGQRETILSQIDAATAAWKTGERRDIHHDMHMLVWGIVRTVLYGLTGGEANEDLFHRLETWMFRRFSPWVNCLPYNLPGLPYRAMLKEAEWLEEKFLAIMKARRAAGGDRPDALTQLMGFTNEGGAPVPDRDLVGHAVTLFLVAYETTGNTLTWTLFLLAQHPAVAAALLDELSPYRDALPPPDKLLALPMLDRVLRESMRILPAVPFNRRVVARDAEIGGFELPEKTKVYFSIYETHHDRAIYDEPERFDPSRWETIDPNPAEYLPFGMGKKMCLGSSMAQFVVKHALASILPKWRLELEPHCRVDRRTGISLGPSHGMPMILHAQDGLFTASPVRGNVHDMVDLTVATPVTRVPSAPNRRAA